MLGVRGVAPPSTPPEVCKRASRTRDPIFFSLLSQNQSHKAKLFLFPVPNHTQLFLRRNGFGLFAQKKKQGLSLGSVELEKEAELVEDEGFEFGEIDEEFDYEDEDFDDEEGDDDEADDLMLPFSQMEAWLKNKPRGFGEGKVYDTSIEDKLLEEIEQSRKAQLANLNKHKNESKEAKPKKELKASEVVSSEIRVRINNLPKKKNVQRDLKSAFQGVRGIVNISPAVAGNKKTRDPVCKGFGFVDFKSLEDANRFVQMFSGQSIVFGKIQKQIKCEILKSCDGGYKGSVEHGHSSASEPRLAASEDEVDQDPDIGNNDPLMQFGEDDDFEEFDEDFDDENDIGDFKLLRASEQGDNDSMESELEPEPDSLSLESKEKAEGEQKKSVPSRKSDKIPQPSTSGSLMRLKVQEKAELYEVFSRHGLKEAMASTEISMASEDGGDEEFNNEENDPPLPFWEAEDFYEDDEEFDDEDDVEDIELVRASEEIPRLNMKNKANAKKSEAKKRPKKIPITRNPALAEAASDSYSSPKQKEKAKAPKQRSVAKEKASKVLKLKIPGSAKRLKGQDKAKLADVFSKYGAKETLASKEM